MSIKKNQREELKNMTSIVETPVPNYCGTIAGIQFAYGRAEILSGCWLETWFREKGYRVRNKT